MFHLDVRGGVANMVNFIKALREPATWFQLGVLDGQHMQVLSMESLATGGSGEHG